jgi:hypothetical protein
MPQKSSNRTPVLVLAAGACGMRRQALGRLLAGARLAESELILIFVFIGPETRLEL